VTYFDEDAASGAWAAKQYKDLNEIRGENVDAPEKVARKAKSAHKPSIIICINDFIGSGGQAITGLRDRVIPALEEAYGTAGGGWEQQVKLICVVIVGYADGIRSDEGAMEGRVAIVCGRRLSDEDRAFDPRLGLFADTVELMRARDIAERFGKRLFKNGPLGWEDGQALLVFPTNVPNNTLPILWSRATINKQPWKPLFPRS
jgi:hypothetical protein